MIDGWKEGFAKPDLILDQLWPKLNGWIQVAGLLKLLNILSFYVALHWKKVLVVEAGLNKLLEAFFPPGLSPLWKVMLVGFVQLSF